MPITLNGATGIQTPLGSAGSPVDSNTTTPTTGVYYPSATTWGVSTAGTNALYIDASQNVGIGTSSPGYTLDVRATTGSISATSNTGTNYAKLQCNNIGGSYQFGIDNSAGTNFGSGVGYARVIWNDGAYPTILYTNSAERMRIDSSGNLLVGTTSSTAHLTLKQSSNNYGGGFALVRQDTTDNWQFRVDGSNTLLFGYNSSDRGSFNSGTGAYTALSDRNKKKDFENSTIGLSAVMQLKPTLYRMIDEEETSDKHLGFIAQEVKEVILPAYVELGNENNKFIGLDYQPIVAVLVKAIQELKATVDTQAAEITALKAKVGA